MHRLVALVLACCTALTGCGSAGYYGQAIGGHLSLVARARPIDELLNDPALAPELRQRLERVTAIRSYAVQALALPDNDSYRHYADLERPFAVWNVFAAPELSLKPKEWCFLFAGCVPYRGYFSRTDAEQAAAELRAQGYEVYVGGVSAYSTLGWFADPLLNTMFERPEPELAGLLFHELAHQKLYVADDTTFNESFATAVEREGVRRWLASRHADAEYAAYLARQHQREAFLSLVLRHRARLQALYASHENDDAKRAGKRALLDDFHREYAALKQDWGGYTGYDRWVMESNNASLASVGLYHDHVEAFEALLAQQGGDMKAFYAAAEKLARLPRTERMAALTALLTRTAHSEGVAR